MTTYKIDDMELITRIPVSTRELVSWKNVWLLAQTLIIINALMLAADMPIRALVVALAITWVIYQTNKI